MADGDVSVALTSPKAKISILCDGNGDFVDIDSFTLSNSYTISVWYYNKRPNADATTDYIFYSSVMYLSKKDTAGDQTLYRYRHKQAGGVDVLKDFNIPVGRAREWNHYILTFDNTAGTMTIYLNGVYLDGAAAVGFLGFTEQPRLSFAGGSAADGMIGDFRCFTTSITASQAANLYAGEIDTVLLSKLKVWLPLQKDYLDYSGNGLDGTNTNCRLGIWDTDVKKAITNVRTSIDDHQLIAMTANNQVINVNINE